ncbi:hypothetical protein JOB18_043522 [Solea senegalensis]|uniref:G-protein coupled receptors family 1 profile domain-containing protein n=1 Tax=Solea senegalensis TaxID=28829 RepID=A0AAV6QYR6_SOLSE|nr:hypothetical protein JOB18_043522 [Solea senegalensis]
MSVNSSSSWNASLLPYNTLQQKLQCLHLAGGSLSTTLVMVTHILLRLPLNVLVLFLSHQRWRRPSSTTALTHSDVFTVHTSVLELICSSGAVLTFSGVHTDTTVLAVVGILLSSVYLTGIMLFHTLTCVERHLAVAHPVTYLGLKNVKGIRMRNVTIGIVWLMSFAGSLTMYLSVKEFTVTSSCILGVVLIIVCFCSLSVLSVLVRPGPVDRSGRRQQVDQSKLRAFHTIMIILCVLLLKFGGSIFVFSMSGAQVFDVAGQCLISIFLFWSCLPSDLVLPLLFLLRAGKLRCWKTPQQSD